MYGLECNGGAQITICRGNELLLNLFDCLFSSRQRNMKKHQEVKNENPGIKKPPNAFKLFMMEQRPSFLTRAWKTRKCRIERSCGQNLKFSIFQSIHVAHIVKLLCLIGCIAVSCKNPSDHEFSLRGTGTAP